MSDEETPRRSVSITGTISQSQEDYDMLAYFAEFTACAGDMVENAIQRTLLGLLIENTKHRFPIKSKSGGASRVFVMNSETLLETMIQNPVENLLPQTVAVKIRKVQSPNGNIKDWQALKTLATELRITTDREIRAHANIVSFLGNCWQYAEEPDSPILPVIVYEATSLGDLHAYQNQHKNLTLGVQLQLGLGVARGVACLHNSGIIHCDLKPKNVLVFPNTDANHPVIPKIIDFDNAIIYQDSPEQTTSPQGTELWNSPEQGGDHVPIHKNDLFKIDIFSLGLVLLNLLTSNFLEKCLSNFDKAISRAYFADMSLREFKRTGTLAENVFTMLKDFANISGPEADTAEYIDFRRFWARASKVLTQALDGELRYRVVSAMEIESELQRLLREVSMKNLLDYHNEEIELSQNLGRTINFLPYSDNSVAQRESIKKMFRIFEDLLASYQPQITENSDDDDDEIPVELLSRLGLDETTLESLQTVSRGSITNRTSAVPSRRIRDVSTSNAVVKMSNNLGTFAAFPKTVMTRLMNYLEATYSSQTASVERRCKAAFEHAIASIALYISEGPETNNLIDRALKMLRFAADHGHSNAQYIVGWLGETFGRNQYAPSSLAEVEMLKEGVLQGSRVAQRRLQKLNKEEYETAMKYIRTKCRGVGGISWKIPDEIFLRRDVQSNLWIYAASGNVEALREFLASRPESTVSKAVNIHLFGDKATPLIEASRSGHAEIVHLLLEHGADASMTDYDGVGPLHFLSSFEPSEMEKVARTLIAHGCQLEGWTSGVSYHDAGGVGLDRVYGNANGTPLLWAVAADCIDAVRVLLRLGANPFSRQPKAIALAPNNHYFPVLWAARFHQSEILELLLRNVVPDAVGRKLNISSEEIQTGMGPVFPLGFACLYFGGQVLARILLHGPRHVEQCFKTIDVLLSAGADPEHAAKLMGEPAPAFVIASQAPQPYAMHALLQWKNGLLRPNTAHLCSLLSINAKQDHRAIFNELVAMEIHPEGAFSWPVIVGSIGKEAEQEFYVDAIISKHRSSDPGPADYTMPFFQTLFHGNLKSAKVIYNRADLVDPVHMKYWQDAQSRVSILSHLIMDAKRHPTRAAAVKTFLDLVGPRDEVFESVTQECDETGNSVMGEGNLYSLNALQLALLFRFDSGTLSNGVEVFDILLSHFNDPNKHLACRYGPRSSSLLHMAVEEGNHAILDKLLLTEGIDFDLRNSKGYTAFDSCFFRWQDSLRDTNKDFMAAINRGSKTRTELEEQWECTTMEMIESMEKYGASRCGMINSLFKRLSTTKIMFFGVSTEGRTKKGELDLSDIHIFGNMVVREVARLAVGKCFYFPKKSPSSRTRPL